MTVRKFKSLAKRWQSKLGLSDWEIHFAFIPANEMSQADAVGLADWQAEYKLGRVEVDNDAERPDAEIEHTLVHELLHIVLEGHVDFPRGYKKDPLFERGLNIIATALKATK